MVLHNPGNWHWTSKDCRPWAKSWFEQELLLSAYDKKAKVAIDKLQESTGDCDIAMRKGKVITIYDIKLVLGYSGTLADEEETKVDGKITIPEVMHDNDEDDYVFEVEVFSDTKEKSAVRDLVKTDLVPRLRTLLQKFPEALVEAHGKDVLIASQAGVSPAVGTASNASNANPSTKANASLASASTSRKTVNTSSISETFEFQTLAKELYITFIDKARVAAWSRAAPNLEPTVGGKYSLFNGNIEGEFLELEENVKIAQTWRLKAWPTGHYAKLTMTFDQGLDGTNLRMVMDDVPLSQEDVVKSNFDQCKSPIDSDWTLSFSLIRSFDDDDVKIESLQLREFRTLISILDYIRPIKTTFGFGAVL
ncbi:Uncharacterized protein C1711.08 [Taphrina deformans PYCC 5710]|uniref:Uncharacterized protein C1711.08 n=1 Tax=Taphrina deformans (strain PYCC 5710 / ATCC 11124 / CBS 356.35 / IMI 108563 / JCM 9778 / NBRC 8474) TaxID=1097556 RepID=R4X899_TAPDE|nr:Uncharacterized protein C1711.08 [Taphrina deformans PYCC 5710]|eukprot:CCG81779.1 Uncharacterized protein C1711.08 [Taphrina deformans PYCC 5710]